jgi:hypothetical protein
MDGSIIVTEASTPLQLVTRRAEGRKTVSVPFRRKWKVSTGYTNINDQNATAEDIKVDQTLFKGIDLTVN